MCDGGENGGQGCGAFNISNLEGLYDRSRSGLKVPVIIGVSEGERDRGRSAVVALVEFSAEFPVESLSF